MNWEAISAIAEVIGLVAVIASLIYLARQIAQNTRMMHREAHIDRVRHIAEPLIASPERLAQIIGKISEKEGAREPVTLAFMKAYDLEYEEAIAWLRYLHRLWFGYEADFLYTGRSAQLDRIIPAILSFKNAKLFWDYEKQWLFSAEFVTYVDSLLENDGSGPPTRETP